LGNGPLPDLVFLHRATRNCQIADVGRTGSLSREETHEKGSGLLMQGSTRRSV